MQAHLQPFLAGLGYEGSSVRPILWVHNANPAILKVKIPAPEIENLSSPQSAMKGEQSLQLLGQPRAISVPKLPNSLEIVITDIPPV